MARKPIDSPSPPVQWSKAAKTMRLARLLGVTDRMLLRLFATGTIRHRRLSRNVWQIDLAELPPAAQVELGGADPYRSLLAAAEKSRSVARRYDVDADAA